MCTMCKVSSVLFLLRLQVDNLSAYPTGWKENPYKFDSTINCTNSLSHMSIKAIFFNNHSFVLHCYA